MLRSRALSSFNPAAPGPIGGTTPGPITGTLITATTGFKSAAGSVGTVAYGFTNIGGNNGIYSNASGYNAAISGADVAGWYSNSYRLVSGAVLGWVASGSDASGAADTGLSRISAGLVGVGTGAAGSFAGATKQTKLYIDYTNTGTVGSVTIDKAAGRVNLGAGQTSLTLTNAVITAASHIFLNADGAPGNVVAVQFYAVAGAGSCTINAVPAITNQTAIDFFVVNAD